jgi:hypothetical protein
MAPASVERLGFEPEPHRAAQAATLHMISPALPDLGELASDRLVRTAKEMPMSDLATTQAAPSG